MISRPAQACSLSSTQTARSIALGIFFWFVAALCVRYFSSAESAGGPRSLLTFALSIPGGWLVMWITRRVAALQPAQMVPGLAMGVAAASFCDGIAMTWTRALYGSAPEQILPGAAWILWGVGCILTWAFVGSHQRQDQN
jgi:hypothetical protein